MTITERDVKILATISKYRYLTADQIMLLHFPNLKKTQSRLKFLFDKGLIGRLTRLTAVIRGKCEYVYFLRRKSLDIIGNFFDESSVAQFALAVPKKHPRTLNHLLDVNMIGIYFEISAYQNKGLRDCQVDGLNDGLAGGLNCRFIAEFQKSYDGITNKPKRIIGGRIQGNDQYSYSRSLTPDFIMILEKTKEKKLLFFGEVDKGSESIEALKADKYSFKHKVRAYLNYFDSLQYKTYEKDFEASFNGFRVLVITSSKERLRNILRAIMDFDDVGFFWLTTMEQITANILTAKVWTVASPDNEGLQSIL